VLPDVHEVKHVATRLDEVMEVHEVKHVDLLWDNCESRDVPDVGYDGVLQDIVSLDFELRKLYTCVLS